MVMTVMGWILFLSKCITLRPPYPVPQTVTVFGEEVFKEVNEVK